MSIYHVSIGKPILHADEEFSNLASLVKETVVLECLMHEKISSIVGDIHSSMTLNIHDHIFLVDSKNFYLYNFNTRNTKIYKD